jgi:hypothetical protein
MVQVPSVESATFVVTAPSYLDCATTEEIDKVSNSNVSTANNFTFILFTFFAPSD